MTGRRSSGEILRLAKFQGDRPTVDYSESSEADAPTRRNTPNKIGRYTVLDVLGVGGMGVVCTAYDPKLDRKIALKLLRKKLRADSARLSTGQARLIREAQSLAKLSHPNIVTVHDVDTYEDQIYMAMEYVDGASLDRWLVRETRSWRDVISVFIDAARGLAAAHEAGITHRDFKPANVLIGKDGRVLVADFGLAKSEHEKRAQGLEDSLDPDARYASGPGDEGGLMDVIGSTQDTKLTQVGRAVGTPAYMAPEQFLGLPVGPKTDQFSFGVALFESLYGDLPFPDESRDELIERVTEGRVSEPPKDTTVPGWVHRVVLRALQPRPEERFASMDQVIAALQADPAKRRRRMLVFGAGALLAGLSAWAVLQALTPDDVVCSGAEAQIDEVWSPTRKAEIATAFAAIDRPFAEDAWRGVEAELDARTRQWVSDHVEVCEATNVRREQSESLMDVRMACLQRRRGEMQALVEVLGLADDRVVTEAVTAVQSLEPSEACRTVLAREGLEVDDPTQRERAEEIERRLARAKAFVLAGKPDLAIGHADGALQLARDLDHGPTLARAALEHARLYADQSTDPIAAKALLVEAIDLARTTEQPILEVGGWAKLIVIEGRNKADAALALRLPADMALRRADDPRSEAVLEQAVGTVLFRSGNHEAGLEAQIHALDLYKDELGEQHTTVAGVLSNIGAEYASLRQTTQARQYLGRASEMVERLYGAHHPLLGTIHMNLGSVLKADGDEEGAHLEYERAAAILGAALPSTHPRTLRATIGLAQTEAALGIEGAQARFERTIAVMRTQPEPELALLGNAHNSLGHLLRQQANAAAVDGDATRASTLRADAVRNFQAALEAFEKAANGEPSNTAKMVLLNLCLLEVDREDLAAAATQCNKAWALQRRLSKMDSHGVRAARELAEAWAALGRREDAIALLREAIEASGDPLGVSLRLSLGTMLWEEPSRRDEAIEIVRAARTGLRASDGQDAIEKVDGWLHAHPRAKGR